MHIIREVCVDNRHGIIGPRLGMGVGCGVTIGDSHEQSWEYGSIITQVTL